MELQQPSEKGGRLTDEGSAAQTTPSDTQKCTNTLSSVRVQVMIMSYERYWRSTRHTDIHWYGADGITFEKSRNAAGDLGGGL